MELKKLKVKDKISIVVCNKCGKHHISPTKYYYERCDICGSQLENKKYIEIINDGEKQKWN